MNDEKMPHALAGAAPHSLGFMRRSSVMLAAAALSMGNTPFESPPTRAFKGSEADFKPRITDLPGVENARRPWDPITTAETERKMDMARMEGEAERLAKAQARRERRAARSGKAA